MNILVCIKQVPDTTEIKIDPVKNTLIRDGVPSIVNTFDAYALEGAARLKDRNPDTKVIVVSMGPPQAKNALKECLSKGGEKAYLVTDRVFGGSDTLATSYILSNAVKAIEKREGIKFDAIFCGKQAIDGDTAQVGPEMAEHLGLPQVTYALEVEEAGDELIVLREGQDANQKIAVKTPCLLTFTKPSFDPRYATIKSKMAANRAEIPSLTAADFTDINMKMIGLKGSPTRVKKTFVPRKKTGGIKIKEDSATASASKLAAMLGDAQVI